MRVTSRPTRVGGRHELVGSAGVHTLTALHRQHVRPLVELDGELQRPFVVPPISLDLVVGRCLDVDLAAPEHGVEPLLPIAVREGHRAADERLRCRGQQHDAPGSPGQRRFGNEDVGSLAPCVTTASCSPTSHASRCASIAAATRRSARGGKRGTARSAASMRFPDATTARRTALPIGSRSYATRRSTNGAISSGDSGDAAPATMGTNVLLATPSRLRTTVRLVSATSDDLVARGSEPDAADVVDFKRDA